MLFFPPSPFSFNVRCKSIEGNLLIILDSIEIANSSILWYVDLELDRLISLSKYLFFFVL